MWTTPGRQARRSHAAGMDLVGWQELVRRAGSPARARRWVREGLWWRVFRHVYAPCTVDDGRELRAAALRLALPDGVALSHRAALWVLGLDVLGAGLDVTAPRGRRVKARPGVVPHTAALPDHELCEVGGLLVVSAARAVVDVARAEPLVEAVAVGDAVLRAGAATAEQVAAAVEDAFGLRGVLRARAVLPHLEPRSETPMESRLRMRFVLGGIEGIEVQTDFYDDEGHLARSDLHVRGVLVEYDGREARLDKDVFVRERRRQNRIAAAGLELRRFTAADYYVRPAAVVCAELAAAVAAAHGGERSRARRGPDTLRPPRLRPLATLADVRRAA